ncbi:hypothetical protein SYNPS1DRAFT_12418 [Syncephalis pseudoplumigaleata]|uniref:Ribosomal RNA-processing protein 40 n=1 Tax=Syncephalis pseudoplumigaleata TaxID=1712513 RepID=A0A4P9Z550_9FUNG|nr:hypothetical protein SYNPS1DRAFT_12418 [Syncephalis pseudoplumigaleata]|eukprot:RKP27615.1 hypothetical protein SYNPS1DRAFT_12418 [Syncephalis pseudoplumigaleata]
MAKIILPGEQVDVFTVDDTVDASLPVCLGPGLVQSETAVHAIQGGLLRSQETARHWWIESNKKRYVPAVGEPVIGQVTSRHAEEYRVDIGGAHTAVLPALAFEGATKKNRPNLKVGALVYARVSLADKDMEPELECVNPSTGRSDGYGELTDGFMVHCGLAHCLRLLRPNAAALTALGQHIPFEVAVGMNGRVWIRADTIDHTILGATMITRSEHVYGDMTTALTASTELDACRRLVKQLVQQL